jgi:hypothetical protein
MPSRRRKRRRRRRKNLKFTLEQSMKAQRGSIGTVPLFL